MKVKICCIKSVAEAKLAVEFGASAIGLVSQMPSGPGVIDDGIIKEISSTIPQGIASFYLTSNVKAKEIVKQHKVVNTNTIQIVDELAEGTYVEIKSALPNVDIVQVIHVLDQKSVEKAIHVSQYVDYILLDSGNPNLAIKELGGTGKVHNWEISSTIRERVAVPVYLAGGLNSKNVREAIDVVKPYGVDLCSGVRTNGNLDREKLEAFFRALN